MKKEVIEQSKEILCKAMAIGCGLLVTYPMLFALILWLWVGR